MPLEGPSGAGGSNIVGADAPTIRQARAASVMVDMDDEIGAGNSLCLALALP